MTDEQLQQLVQDRLSDDDAYLYLGDLGLDDDDVWRLMPMLAALTNLMWLDLYGNNIGDAGIAALCAALPGCTIYT
jgi:hypothetical protein